MSPAVGDNVSDEEVPMTEQEYLDAVLEEQTLEEGGDELSALRKHRDDVEKLLRAKFGNAPQIKYGGSYRKGTMVKESYDLDLPCYFPRDDDSAGETLKDIFESVQNAAAEKYVTQSKGSAIRLHALDGRVDFHIDLVPGRYVDGADGDVFLHCASGDKQRLKTNLDVQIDHVKNSGVRPAIRLLKVWAKRNRFGIKTFALELLVIELLKGRKSRSLPDQLEHVLKEFRDNADDLCVEDPANPTGNDLSELLSDTVRWNLQNAAKVALEAVERGGWKAVFGELKEEHAANKLSALMAMAGAATVRPRPYFGGKALV